MTDQKKPDILTRVEQKKRLELPHVIIGGPELLSETIFPTDEMLHIKARRDILNHDRTLVLNEEIDGFVATVLHPEDTFIFIEANSSICSLLVSVGRDGSICFLHYPLHNTVRDKVLQQKRLDDFFELANEQPLGIAECLLGATMVRPYELELIKEEIRNYLDGKPLYDFTSYSELARSIDVSCTAGLLIIPKCFSKTGKSLIIFHDKEIREIIDQLLVIWSKKGKS